MTKRRAGCQPKGLLGHFEKMLVSDHVHLNMKIKTVSVGVMKSGTFKLQIKGM